MGAIGDKIIGTAKKIEGKLTGDKLRMAQGSAQQTKGKIEGGISGVARKIKAGARKVRAKIVAKVDRASAKVERGAARTRARTR